MDPDDIDGRMAAQPDRATWLEMADHVIRNEGSIEALARSVNDIVVTLAS